MLNKLAMPLGFALLLAGCQTSSAPPFQQIPPHTVSVAVCGSGDIMMQTTLWFGGQNAHGAPVSDSEWQQFEACEVVPRFHDNYSVYEDVAQGQKRKTLVIVHQLDVASSDSINVLCKSYQTRFNQSQVTRVDALVCVAQ